MAYELGWTKNHPGHIVYILDISGSMARNGKIDFLISAVQNVIRELIADATPGDVTEDRMSITIIGYNSKATKIVDNLTLNQLFDRMVASETLLDKESNAKPQWQTFTADAFKLAQKDIIDWINSYSSFPDRIPAPLVVHVTDGYPYEGKNDNSAFEKALCEINKLKQIKTDDGNVRLFNIHIEPNFPTFILPTASPTGSPEIEMQLKFLYETASPVDEKALENANVALGRGTVKPGSKFMVSNASGEELLTKFLKFASTPSSRRPTQIDELPMPE